MRRSNMIFFFIARGTWTMGVLLDALVSSTSLIVSDGSIAAITVLNNLSVIAAFPQAFTATASNSYGNTWDITALASWKISASVAGDWVGNTYYSADTGTWTVTASYYGVIGANSLTVIHNLAVQVVVVSPSSSMCKRVNIASTERLQAIANHLN